MNCDFEVTRNISTAVSMRMINELNRILSYVWIVIKKGLNNSSMPIGFQRNDFLVKNNGHFKILEMWKCVIENSGPCSRNIALFSWNFCSCHFKFLSANDDNINWISADFSLGTSSKECLAVLQNGKFLFHYKYRLTILLDSNEKSKYLFMQMAELVLPIC